MMEYTYLGRTGLKVSRLCLGTMNFGPYTEEKEAFRIMDAALDAGINFFDTANVYGEQQHRGWTEEIIGRWFAQGGGRRERVVLATKVYSVMDNPLDGPNKGVGLSAYKIHRHIEESLRRLQTDYVELYQMHHIDKHITWDETWEAMGLLVQQGKVVYIGSSNFAGWNIIEAQYTAKERNMLGLVCEQHKYNLTCRLPELEVIPAARKMGLGVIAWSPLAAGLLAGNVFNDTGGIRTKRLEEQVKKRQKSLRAYSKLCCEHGEKESNVALAWILSNPDLTGPIIGPRTLEQFNDNLRSLEIKIDKELAGALDELFPGPGGEAPEAYAW